MACWTGEGWRLMDGRRCGRSWTEALASRHGVSGRAGLPAHAAEGIGLHPLDRFISQMGAKGNGASPRWQRPARTSRWTAGAAFFCLPDPGDVQRPEGFVHRRYSGARVDDGRGFEIRAGPIHRSCSEYLAGVAGSDGPMAGTGMKKPLLLAHRGLGRKLHVARCGRQGDVLSQGACISLLALRSPATLPPGCDAAGSGRFAPSAAGWSVVLAGAFRAGVAALPSVSGTST